MQSDKALISRLEKLARLQLDDSEKDRFAHDLAGILKMVDQLRELDTTGIEPLAYPVEVAPDLRADLVNDQLSQNASLSNAPKHDNQFFLVPKMKK